MEKQKRVKTDTTVTMERVRHRKNVTRVVIYPTVNHPRSKTIYSQDFQINIVTVDACDQYSSSSSTHLMTSAA